jgi:hypothetical protein
MQLGSVWDYQLEFERLLSRVGNLSPTRQLGCFISGLKESILHDVQAAHPSTIIEAIRLARFCKALEHFFGVDVTAPVEPEPPPLPSPNLSRARPCCIPSQSSHRPITHTAQTYIPMSVVPGKTIQMLSRNSWPYCNSKSILHVYMIGPLMRMPHIV